MNAPAIPESPVAAVNLEVRTDIHAPIDAARPAPEEDALQAQAPPRVERETYDRILEILDQPASGPGVERLMGARRPWAP